MEAILVEASIAWIKQHYKIICGGKGLLQLITNSQITPHHKWKSGQKFKAGT